MKILYLLWECCGNSEMIQAMRVAGHDVAVLQTSQDGLLSPEITDKVKKAAGENGCDIVYGFNYFPHVAEAAKDIGIDMVDETCYMVQQLMYWPSTSFDGEFIFKTQEGPPLDPDVILARYRNWRDTSEWPTSSREDEVIKRDIKKQADRFLAGEGAVIRNEQAVRADCIPAEGGMYNVVLRVTEGGASVMEIRLQVPDKALAEEICRKWPEKNEQIYNSLIENLF